MTLSKDEQLEILIELIREGFPTETLEDTLQLIVLRVEFWRINKDHISELPRKGGVVERLIAKYATQEMEAIQ